MARLPYTNAIEKVQRPAAQYIHNNYCLDTSVSVLIDKLTGNLLN